MLRPSVTQLQHIAFAGGELIQRADRGLLPHERCHERRVHHAFACDGSGQRVGQCGGSPADERSDVREICRLRHMTPAFTMSVYLYVLPGMQRDAADIFTRLVTCPANFRD